MAVGNLRHIYAKVKTLVFTGHLFVSKHLAHCFLGIAGRAVASTLEVAPLSYCPSFTQVKPVKACMGPGFVVFLFWSQY